MHVEDEQSQKMQSKLSGHLDLGGEWSDRCRRLHFAGCCFRVAGEHFKVHESYDQVCPPEALYTHRCRDCFPSRQVAERKAEEELDVSAGEELVSSSSSSESSAAAPEPADS